MKVSKNLLLVYLLTHAASAYAAPAALPVAPHAVLSIDTSAPSKPASPMLYGGFIEHFHRQIYGGLFEPGSPLADERGFRKDVIAAMKELKLSVVVSSADITGKMASARIENLSPILSGG